MKIINKKMFLAVGYCTLFPLLGIAAVGQTAIKGVDDIKQFSISSLIENDFKNGVDTIAYKVFEESITQPSSQYRYNVMKNSMKRRDKFLGFFEVDKEIREENLQIAKELGVFTDKETFKAEVELLNVASKTDKPNNRLFKKDNGIVDITDPSHFEGINNLKQVNEKIAKTLASVRDSSSLEKKSKPKA